MIKLYGTKDGEWYTSIRQAEEIGKEVKEVFFDEETLCTLLNQVNSMVDKVFKLEEYLQ